MALIIVDGSIYNFVPIHGTEDLEYTEFFLNIIF